MINNLNFNLIKKTKPLKNEITFRIAKFSDTTI